MLNGQPLQHMEYFRTKRSKAAKIDDSEALVVEGDTQAIGPKVIQKTGRRLVGGDILHLET